MVAVVAEEEVAVVAVKKVEAAKMTVVELRVAELVEDHTDNYQIPGPLL